MTFSCPKFSHINQWLFIRNEVFTPKEIMWVCILGMEMKKWLIETGGLYLHLIHFIDEDGFIILLCFKQRGLFLNCHRLLIHPLWDIGPSLVVVSQQLLQVMSPTICCHSLILHLLLQLWTNSLKLSIPPKLACAYRRLASLNS